jgi:tetratricopeptide (TPR) repeat protein
MLYAFGGYGNRIGWFQSPTALEHWKDRLLVLDSTSGYITVLGTTEYGAQISAAITCYDTGRYNDSYEAWQEVLRRNGNYYLAYDGIGKIKLRKGEYREAMRYLKYAEDDYYYSKAWQLYRKQLIENYLFYFIVALLAFLVLRAVVKWFRRQKEALENYEA